MLAFGLKVPIIHEHHFKSSSSLGDDHIRDTILRMNFCDPAPNLNVCDIL